MFVMGNDIARCGSKPARLLMDEWNAARTDVWLNKNQKGNGDDLQMRLFHDMKVTYQTGKGSNHIVPVLTPKDWIKVTEILNDRCIPEVSGIIMDNIYPYFLQYNLTHM